MNEEQAAIAELMAMSREQLEHVGPDKLKWVCSGKNCNNGTTVWGFGIGYTYYHPRPSIKWFDINTNFWMCEKHFKMYKHLKKNYPVEDVCRRLFDETKIKLISKK